MPFFRYKVMQNGKASELTLEAGSEAEAANTLWRRNISVVRFLGESATLKYERKSLFRFMDRGRFNVNTFTERLAPLLKANIPLEQSLAVIEEGMAGQSGIIVVQELRQGLQEGKKFSELVRARSAYFPPLYPSLIETGEQTGCLAEVVQELRRFMADAKEFKDFVITSSIYPAIILFVTFTMVILLFTFFIPRFSKLFKDAGKELPFLTQIMLDTGNFMKSVWWLWPLLVILLVYLYCKSASSGALKTWKDKILLKLPLIGKIVRDVQVSRFIRTLAIMVRNDVSILRAVSISLKILQNSVIAESFAEVPGELKAGHKLSRALGQSPFMLPGTTAMLRISEESGDVAEMLGNIAESSEREVKRNLKRLTPPRTFFGKFHRMSMFFSSATGSIITTSRFGIGRTFCV